MFNKFLNRTRSSQQEEIQGFICPECKRDFSSIDDLSDHHVKAHPPTDFEESFQPMEVENKAPNYPNGENTTNQIKQDFAELGLSLQEESWYSAELQKELTRVQAENEALRSSVGRSGDAKLDVVSKKAADLAMVVAQLSADLDDERSRCTRLESNLADQQTTNEELCKSHMSLQAKLVQSTSTDDVDVLKQELGKSQLQLDSILLAGEKDVARLQETVDNLNNDKNKLEEKLTLKEAAVEKHINENKTLNTEMGQLQRQLDQGSLAQALSDSQVNQQISRISDLEQQCTRYSEEVRRKEDEKTQLLEKFGGFDTALSQLKIGQDGDGTSNELKLLSANFSEFQSSLQERDAKNSSEIISLREELSSSKAQLASVQGQYSMLENNHEAVKKQVISLEESIALKERECSSKVSELKDKETTLGQKDTEITDLKSTLSNVEASLRHALIEKDCCLSQLCQLQECVTNLEQTSAQQKLHIETSVAEADKRFKKQCEDSYQLDHKLTNLRSDNSQLSLEHSRLKETHGELITREGDLACRVEELELSVNEKEEMVKRHSEVAVSSKELAEEAIRCKEALEGEVEALEEQLEVTSGCVRDLNTRIERKDEMLLELNKKTAKLEAEIAKPCTMCLNYESRLNKSHVLTQELERERAGLKGQVLELETRVAEYQENVDATSERLLLLEYNLDREKDNAINTESLLGATRKKLQESTQLLEGKVGMLESRLEATNNRAACLEDSNRELGVWKERLEQELGENERALQEKAKIHSEEVEDLNNKNAILIAQKMKLNEDVQELNEELERAAAQQGVLKERLNEASEDMETQKKTHQEQLKSLESSTKEMSLELLRTSKSHEEENVKLDKQLHSLRQKLRDSQGVVEELNKECERLYGKVNVNEATLENLMDERQLLQKSVLESEERAVKLRETNRILLTDLEKTQTTLNEIAQEHSHLLYLQEKKNSRKWEEDTEVTHCKSCRKEFGVSLRKHHCRNCGAIYCDACSKYKSSTAASKDKVRVCGPCNKELNP